MNVTPDHARKMEQRCGVFACLFYGVTVGMGIAGAVLAAYGRFPSAIALGAVSLIAAILSLLTARASIRWRREA
jgi:membrane associated rhomboid family serine protease